jgi:hypothetical protein
LRVESVPLTLSNICRSFRSYSFAEEITSSDGLIASNRKVDGHQRRGRIDEAGITP